MPKKAIDVFFGEVVGDGYVERAQAFCNRLKELRQIKPPWSEAGALGTANALFLVGEQPGGWKSKMTAEQFNACRGSAKSYNPDELRAAVRMILDFGNFDFQSYLCYPWLSMDGENWDLPFWETAVCMAPKERRKEISAHYWAMPMFN